MLTPINVTLMVNKNSLYQIYIGWGSNLKLLKNSFCLIKISQFFCGYVKSH